MVNKIPQCMLLCSMVSRIFSRRKQDKKDRSVCRSNNLKLQYHFEVLSHKKLKKVSNILLSLLLPSSLTKSTHAILDTKTKKATRQKKLPNCVASKPEGTFPFSLEPTSPRLSLPREKALLVFLDLNKSLPWAESAKHFLLQKGQKNRRATFGEKKIKIQTYFEGTFKEQNPITHFRDTFPCAWMSS